MLKKYYKTKDGLYLMSKEDIENEVEYIIYKYFPQGLEVPQEIDIELICDKMDINLEYRRLDKNKEILGCCVFR